MAEIASIKDRVAAMEEKLSAVHEQTRINAIFDIPVEPTPLPVTTGAQLAMHLNFP